MFVRRIPSVTCLRNPNGALGVMFVRSGIAK
jgi:hypothetical protein